MVGDLRRALADGGGRDVLKRLLGGERLRVMADAERGFAVEGEFSWLLGAGAGLDPGGCSVYVVAGTGFEPVTFGL
jgi:hypothetical protein